MSILLFSQADGREKFLTLLEQAETDFKATTISYPEWRKRVNAGRYPDVKVTKWWQALDKLRQARELLVD